MIEEEYYFSMPNSRKNWFSFVIHAEYLLEKNIFSEDRLKKMGIGNIDDYHQVITRFLNLYPDFESSGGG